MSSLPAHLCQSSFVRFARTIAADLPRHRRTRSAPWLLTLALAVLFGCSRPGAPAGALVFKKPGAAARTLSLAALVDHTTSQTIETHDPFYERTKRFVALPSAAVLAFAFDESIDVLKKEAFVLHARDGYAVPIEGARLADADAYLAIDDVEIPGFAPIGPRAVSPAPAYLVWKGRAHQDLDAYPRPWQITEIELVERKSLFPHLLPHAQPKGSLAMRGYALFRGRCVHCHAINREGGSMGPDLNVPQSIVAYRPEQQIRDYIRNPLIFRYGVMPPNPDLTDADLDALIAYFRVMAEQPYDPASKRSP